MPVVNDNAMWLCPLCINNKVPYGKSCENPKECGGILNVNAQFYLDENREFKKVKGVKTVGIGAISNE